VREDRDELADRARTVTDGVDLHADQCGRLGACTR
jgi:hypothetical protein